MIIDPRREDPEYDTGHPDFARAADPFAAGQAKYDADTRAAAAERVEVAVSVLKMMLTERHLHLEHTESVLHLAANRVGGIATTIWVRSSTPSRRSVRAIPIRPCAPAPMACTSSWS